MFGYVVSGVIIFGLMYFLNECRHQKHCTTLVRSNNRPYVFLMHNTHYFDELKKTYFQKFQSGYNSSFTFGYFAGFINTLSSCHLKNKLREELFVDGNYDVNVVCDFVNSFNYIEIPEFWYDNRFYKHYPIRIHTDNMSVLISDPQYVIGIIDELLHPDTKLITRGYLLSHLEFLLARQQSYLNHNHLSNESVIEHNTFTNEQLSIIRDCLLEQDNEKLSNVLFG